MGSVFRGKNLLPLLGKISGLGKLCATCFCMPSQPPDPYERNFNFTEFSQIYPLKQQPGQQIDIELNDVQQTVNQTVNRLNEIQNDDGSLRIPGTLPWYQEYLSGVAAAVSSAEQAAESAAAASESSASAGDHELNAYTSAQAAGASETAAAESAQEAGVQAAASSASADAAAQSAADADLSAQAAAASAASINPNDYIPQPAVAPVADQILGYDGTAWVARDSFATVLQEQVRNETGSVLAKGSVVYLNGVSGNKPLAVKAQANTEAAAGKTFGVIAADITDNHNGYVVTSGLIKGLNTQGYTAGLAVWLSPSTPGGFTQTKPVAPNHAVLVGYVVRVHQNQGEILVRVANGYELDELHDVLIESPATGQFLVRDGDLWKNQDVGVVRYDVAQTIDGMDQVTARGNIGLGSAATASTSDFAAAAHTHPVSDLTDFTDQVSFKLGLGVAYNSSAAVTGTPGTDKVIGFDGLYGAWVDRNPFNQSINTTDYVTFGGATLNGPLIMSANGIALFDTYLSQNVGSISLVPGGISIQSFPAPSGYGGSGHSFNLQPGGISFTDAGGDPSIVISGDQGIVFQDSSIQNSSAYTKGEMNSLLMDYAPNASPSLAGTPTAPTATPGTNTTQIATTAFVKNAVDNAVPTIPDASTTVKGIVELATSAEALAGTSETLAVTPKGLRDGLDSVVAGGGGGGVDIQIFGGPASSGTFQWNKPLGAKTVTIKMVGSGGGGSSGSSAATSANRSGGGGGGAGASSTFMELADGLPNQVTVIIGAGGSGGAASSSTTPNSGSPGGATSFGGFNARYGLGSTTTTAGTSGTGAVFTQVGVISGAASAGTTATGGTPTSITTGYLLPTGGGGGAGAAASSTTSAAGGSGGTRAIASGSPFAYNNALAGGAGGTTGGVAATNGSDQDTKFAGGTGGGGGAYITGQLGKAGGNGGWPGGGGGGGGASDSGFLSGAGGNGANGMVIVITTL
jgi:hypothetical protein